MWQSRNKSPTGFHIAVLIGSLHFSGDVSSAVSFVFFGDSACAGNHVLQVCHTSETHTELAQGGWPDIIAQQLAHEAHNQHAVCDDTACADQFADAGVGVQRVEVAGCARVTHQLQVCHRRFDQFRNFVTYLHIFVIHLCRSLGIGRHGLYSFRIVVLFAHDYYLARFEHGYPLLVRILYLCGDDIHRAALSLARFAINDGRHAGQDIARMDGREIFILFLAVQNAHDVNARAHQLAYHLAIAPEGECRWAGWIKWHIVITGRLRLFFARIDRVIIANGERQLANFTALDLEAERGKALTYNAFVEHRHCSLLDQGRGKPRPYSVRVGVALRVG